MARSNPSSEVVLELLGRSYADVVTSPDVEPRLDSADPAEQFAAYLDHYRAVVVHKLDGLTEAQLRESRLPSGWTPLELLTHLVHMERRWFVWGFLGEDVADPWGDWTVEDPWKNLAVDPSVRWQVADDVTAEGLAARLEEVGARTRGVLQDSTMETTGAPGARFPDGPPTLRWICFHVLQEYARHAGHLDIVSELAAPRDRP